MQSTINMDAPLTQIGQKLKTAREAQNLTLRNIYEKTKIPVAHLQGIDSGNDEDLPEPVYVAGYIRRYADIVGLDGHGLSEEYRFAVEGPSTKKARPAGESHYVPPVNYGRRHNDAPPSFKTIYFNAICIVGVVGLISYLSMTQMNNQANQSDPSLASLKDSASRFAQISGQSTGPGGAAITPGTPGDGSSRLSLSASQHVWVEVKSVASGDSLYTGYLEQGDRRDFQDAQGLRVRADNGGSLAVSFDGKSETFGEAGKVAERTFMAKTAAPAAEPVQATAPPSTPSEARPAAVTRRPTRTAQSTERRERYRNVDETPSRDYIPGESLGGGGTRSIDVPYRYTEGRLDSD